MNAAEWLAFALVVITALYVVATFFILRANQSVVRAMNEQIEAQVRPYVVVTVFVRVGTIMLCLMVKNIGRSPATNLRMQLDRDFFAHGEKREDSNLAKLAAFSQPIASLPPNAEMVFSLGTGPSIFGTREDSGATPTIFKVTATYASPSDRKYSEETAIDLRPFFNSSVPLDPVADEVKKLRESIERLGARMERRA